MIVVDTGGLYAFLDRSDAWHTSARAKIEEEPGPFLLSPFVLAELDWLVQTRLGIDAECELLDDVEAGVYTLVPFDAADLREAVHLVRQYSGLGIGLADASVAVVAARFRTLNLLTTDQRHFRAIQPLYGGDAFHLSPIDG